MAPPSSLVALNQQKLAECEGLLKEATQKVKTYEEKVEHFASLLRMCEAGLEKSKDAVEKQLRREIVRALSKLDPPVAEEKEKAQMSDPDCAVGEVAMPTPASSSGTTSRRPANNSNNEQARPAREPELPDTLAFDVARMTSEINEDFWNTFDTNGNINEETRGY